MGCVTSYFSQKGQYDVSEKDETPGSKGKAKKEQGCDPALKEKDAQDDRRPIKKPTDEEGKEREDAALKIQTKYRQYQAGKTVQQLKNEQAKTSNASDESQDSGSGTPQSPTFDAHNPKLNEAATRVQAGVKGYLTRKELQTIKEGKKAKEGDVSKTESNEEVKSKDEGHGSLLGFQHQITSQLSDLQKQAEATKAELNQQIQAKATQMQENAKLAREQAEAKAAEAKAIAEEAKQAVQAKIEEGTKAANQTKQTVVTTIDEKIELAKQSAEQAKQTAEKEVEKVKHVVGAKEAEVKEGITTTAATVKQSAEEVIADTKMNIAEVKQTAETKISAIKQTADEIVDVVPNKIDESKQEANKAIIFTKNNLQNAKDTVCNATTSTIQDIEKSANITGTSIENSVSEVKQEVKDTATTICTSAEECKDTSVSKLKEIESTTEKLLMDTVIESKAKLSKGTEMAEELVNGTQKEYHQNVSEACELIDQTTELANREIVHLQDFSNDQLHQIIDNTKIEEPDELPLSPEQINAAIGDLLECDTTEAQGGIERSKEEVELSMNGELEVKKKIDGPNTNTKKAVAKSSSVEFREQAVMTFSGLAQELESEVKEIKKNIKEKKKRNRKAKLDKQAEGNKETNTSETKNVISTDQLDSCLQLLKEQTEGINEPQSQLFINLNAGSNQQKHDQPLLQQSLDFNSANNFSDNIDINANDTATQGALIHIELLETEAELLQTEAELFEAEVERAALTDLGAQLGELSNCKIGESLSHQVEEKLSNITTAADSQVSSLEHQLDSHLQSLKQGTDSLIQTASSESEELRHLMAHKKETAKHDFEAELESQLENLQQTKPIDSLKEEAATKIQAGFRGYKARQEVKAIVDNVSQETQQKAEEFDKAATKIQASFRGYRVRKELNQGDRV